MRLNKILKEATPPSRGSSKFPGKFHLGGGYYSSKQGGEAEFKSDGKNLKPLSPEEKAAHNQQITQPAKTTQPTLTPAQQAAANRSRQASTQRKQSTTPRPTPQPKDVKAIAPAPHSTPSDEKIPKKLSTISRIKNGIKNWSDKEKEFFKNHVHKGNTPLRRNLVQATAHKVNGAWVAVKHGFKHEAHTFKEAAVGVKNLVSGKKMTTEQAHSLKSVGVKVLMTALTGAVLGHATHGAGSFGLHVMEAYLPHIIGETIILGGAKAALHAGAEEENDDVLMMKFFQTVLKRFEEGDIPPEIIEKAIESWNAKKAAGEVPEDDTPTTAEAIDRKKLKETMLNMINDTICVKNELRKEISRLKRN